MAQQQAGQLDDAEPVYRTLLAKQPRNAQIASLLGLLLLQRGRSREALAVLQPLIEAAVEDAALHNAHALALGALARFAEAAQAAGRAAALQPKVAELQINLGNALRKAGRTEEAQAAYRRASALRPELAAAQIGLGQAQAELGDAAAAIESYRNALSLQPQSTRAFYHWALALKGGGAIDPAVVERFAQRLADGGPSGPGADGEAAMLHTALGIVADKAGDYDSAFAHFQAGKAATRRDLERRGEAFDPAAHSRFIDALIAAFPDGGKPIEMAASARAIFVVGMPRSGTTLVEQILASHSKVTGGDELPFLPWLVAKIDGYPAGMAAQFPESLLGLAQDYLESLTAIDPAAERITDKLPLNFLHLGVIARLFPQATVVHCLRDPLDTCLSCFQQNIRAPYTCDLAELGLFYREYRRLMAHWRARLPLRLIEVSHEALVAEPEDEIRRLIGAAGLEWEEACLSFHTTKRAIGTASQMQVRQGISKRAIGRWRNYASHLQPLVTALGQSLP
ncbi:MAG: sulfotransferase [Kiloniellales bacterium]